MSETEESLAVISTRDERSSEETANGAEALVLMKHPLEHTWSFWMYTNDKKKWEDNLVHLTSFSTIEDYWCLYHHMKQPTELNMGQEYSVFKQGIQPKWEDAANGQGGRWIINIERKRSDLDWMWLDVVLLMIGENFENHNHLICGAVASVKARFKISIWTGNASDERGTLAIGRRLKEQLGIQGKLGYQVHNATKNLYTL